MGDVLHLVPPDGIQRQALRNRVNAVPVGACDNGGVVGGLCPALQLDAVHTGALQIVQVVDHAHIPGVHDVGALFVFKYGEIFPGPLFLHQSVLIAAGLGAGPPVGVPARHVVAQQASAGVADAHGTVTEGFKLQFLRHSGPDFGDFGQTQLSCQHNPLGAQVIPALGAGVVGNGLLGGDVPLAVRGIFSGQGKGPQIRQNQGVHPGAVQQFQVFRKVNDFLVSRHGVHGYMDLDPLAVGQSHRFGQLRPGEVPGEGAHSKAGACQIHGVRSVENGHVQLFHVPGRGQQFYFFHIIPCCWRGRPRALPEFWRSGADRFPYPAHNNSSRYPEAPGRPGYCRDPGW